MGLDAQAWLQRWDRQQEGYVPDREATFALMFDVLDRLGAAPGRLLDLACGPGSLADRALARYPGAEVVGLDLDLVMLELARRTLGDRVRWVDADLRSPAWTDGLGEFDAVVSATALHWLDAEHLPTLPDGLAAALRPGGLPRLRHPARRPRPAPPRGTHQGPAGGPDRPQDRRQRVRGLRRLVGSAGRGA
jgi:trans-aconitate methyltransferase